MKTWLYLTAEGLASNSADWPCCVWSSAGVRRRVSLGEVARELKGRAVDVLIPMEMCSGLRSRPWPSRNRPRPQAVAFSIEEQLAQNLESLHICVGVRDSAKRYPVTVIERSRFQALLVLLDAQGIDIRAVHVDADLLPDGQPHGVRWFGRWLLGGALPARLSLSGQALAVLKHDLPHDMHWQDEEEDRAAVDAWLLGPGRHPIDLLQGEFRRSRWPMPWRGVAMVALGMSALTWLAGEARVHVLQDESRRLYSQSERQFRLLYPEQRRIVDLAAQFQALQGRANLGRETQVARLVNLTEQVIGPSNVEVQRIDYREEEGWKVQLTASSFVELEQLRERGRQRAMALVLGGASKQDNRVQATLLMENNR
ncbi:type II secretion system protein GspL [Pseudomonas sp. T1.Ur]|uniref:type II secretion system protein GspL n=1 Tax=Pseudomonas sp. T1.Ur TaxID=2928704 RepID=UPI00201DA98A|nr:type II secretion system protein GspL [Pseudomonas sp. T1.Ur]MCL6704240.1 type II secretion system protein GspL [Pseudomonas sp. T1.Ur]